MSEERKLSFHERARSLPQKGPYHASIFWLFLFYLDLLCLTITVIATLSKPNDNSFFLVAALGLLALIFWLISFNFRRSACCPLCKGTPFLDTKASKHAKAVRFFPLNYGTTNFIRAFFTQRFRCHFCGSPFDMLKKNPNIER